MLSSIKGCNGHRSLFKALLFAIYERSMPYSKTLLIPPRELFISVKPEVCSLQGGGGLIHKVKTLTTSSVGY